MPEKPSKRLINIHQEARSEFDRIQKTMQSVRKQCVNDRRFYSIAGAQWEGELRQQFENKPKLEINKVHLSVMRIINEYRSNRITVDFIPKHGRKNDALADTCDGLYRNTEDESCAEEAYDNAFEEAVGGGFGAFRLVSEYEDEYDEDNEHQKIRIEPIYDADTSVFFDLDAKEYDKSDAKYCFVVYSYTRERFEEEFGDNGEGANTWPKDLATNTFFDWDAPDILYVAEYYRVEEVSETVYVYRTMAGDEEKYREEDFDSDPDLAATLDAVNTLFDREKKVKRRKVHKYLMSGNSILEDYGYIAGKHIPIIPVYGKRWYVDNIERCMGHVRLAKDSQRLKNMQTSKLAEISALSTVEKPVVMPEQILGHQQMWADDNVKDYPYLMLNPVKDVNGNPNPMGPVAYTKVPNIPPAMAALLQITDVDMKEVLGGQEAGEQVKANLSGKAIELVQSKLDMQVYIYMSNMAKSIKRSGEVWLSMASELYVESGREMKSVGTQKEVSSIELMKPMTDADTGKVETTNDLSKAKLDVRVDVGPSSSSKRSATVRSITDMLSLTQDPETIQILTATALMNMEGEGISDLRAYFRDKLINMGAAKPTPEEAKKLAAELENQPPDPQTQYFDSLSEEAQANAASSRADTLLTVAKSEESHAKTSKTEAETIEILGNLEIEEQTRAFEAAAALGQFNQEPEPVELAQPTPAPVPR